MTEATGPPEGRQARPFAKLPDLLTALRVPLAVAFVVAPGESVRLSVVLAAGLSDVLDGYWARRVGGSRIGVVLDPICDKIFMGSAFWVVLRSGVLSPLETAAVLLRDITAVVAFLAVSVLGRPSTLPARAGGKLVTLGQLLTLVAFAVESDLTRPLAWATGAMSVYAIADYTRVGWR